MVASGSARPRAEPDELYDRDLERAEIDRLLGGARRGQSGVLVLRGEPGVGKTTLLAHAARRGADMRILRAIGVEPESQLPFSGLHQLMRPVLSLIDRLPDVQGAALRGALAIGPGTREDRFAIAVAALGLLAEVAADGPVLCLVDDGHWLDRPSADALTFVARRLEAEGVVMLFGARAGDARFPSSGLPERTLGGLGSGDAEQLLVERFGPALTPEVRRAIAAVADGNPLTLLEIPPALSPEQRAGRAALPDPMPIGHDLERILLESVHRLSEPAQTLMLVAAAEGSGEADVVLSAAEGMGIPASAMQEVEASGVIRTEGNALVFRHPILRTVIYRSAGLPQRRTVHRALVDVLHGESDADRRAWHRAWLAHAPDDEIADELERTAERARVRSGPAATCEALRRSAELTSSDVIRSRRLAAAARAAWDAGRSDEAAALLRAGEPEADAATVAELRHVQGDIELRSGVPLEGARVLIEGAEHIAEGDPHKALQMLFDAAQCANFAGDLPMLIEAARRASVLPIGGSEPEAAYVELLGHMGAMLEAKDTRNRPALVRALDAVADASEPRWLIWAGAAAAAIGDQARDDALCRRAEAIARRSMAVGVVASVLERIAWTDLMHERIDQASLRSGEGLQLAVEAGLANSACFHRALLAWVAAVRGDRETCTELAEQAAQIGLLHGLAPQSTITDWAMGLLHLGLGRWDDSVTWLEAAMEVAPGAGHPFVAIRALPDLVEAAVRADRLEIAERAAARFTDYLREGAPDWETALATRCRALVAPTPEAKEGLLIEALVFHDRDRRPFGRARTLLLLGEHLRRERRRKEARIPLVTALEAFERVGATPWAERAGRELRATGQTVRRRGDVATADLTVQERQVARLVADGATNRDAASQLFLSPRTVEYHLRSVYAKLGISSRTELIRLQLGDAPNRAG